MTAFHLKKKTAFPPVFKTNSQDRIETKTILTKMGPKFSPEKMTAFPPEKNDSIPSVFKDGSSPFSPQNNS